MVEAPRSAYRTSIVIARTSLGIALPAVLLAGTLGLRSAHADIYTWVDASGTINVSNLAPPDGARVTNIVRSPPPSTTAREDAAREAARRAEVQALTERVQQLENQVEVSSVSGPPPDYRPTPAPPPIQYVVNVAPPPVQYAAVNTSPPPAYGGCDPSWISCSGLWWAYPSIVIVRAPNVRQPIHPVRGGHNFAVRQPMPHSLVQPLAQPLVQPLVQQPALRQPMHTPSGIRKG